MTHTIRVKNADQLYQTAALLISQALTTFSEKKNQVVFGVPGGRSAAGVFKALAGMEMSWDKIHIFLVDERIVPVGDEESNGTLVKNHLLDPLLAGKKIRANQVHLFSSTTSGIKESILQYQKELDDLGGHFDVLLLSAGEDGHIASLFPHHDSVQDESELFIHVPNAPKLPPERMSASRNLISKSDVAVLLFQGGGKKDAFYTFSYATVDPVVCPARIIHTIPESYAVVMVES